VHYVMYRHTVPSMDNAVYEVPCPVKKSAVQYRNAVQYMVFHCQQGTAVNDSISAKPEKKSA
jgi:hypothetical protein